MWSHLNYFTNLCNVSEIFVEGPISYFVYNDISNETVLELGQLFLKYKVVIFVVFK